jgi:nucleoid-associated protein YgaU
MPSSAFRINGFGGDAAQPIGNDISHAAAPAPHLEHQLNSPMDIGRAHQFFQPAQPAQAIGHAAIATPGAVAAPGSDIASLTAKALSAAQQQISPIIQLIMRIPGHIGVMSSVFEAFSNFFMGHADFLGAFDPHLLAMHGADATAHLDAGKEVLAGEHMHFDMHMLPHDAPILGDANFHGLELDSAAGGEHAFDLSYVNEHLLDHGSLDVSGTLDGAKSQFEGLSFTDPHGEIISGPSLSQASPATHLAAGHRTFLDQSFSKVNSMGTAGSQAIAASTAAPSVTSALSQPLSTASTSLNVGANAFGQQASALPAVANATPAAGLGTVSDGGSLSGFSGGSDSASSSMAAVPNNPAASSDLKLALNKAPEGLPNKGFGTNEYGANYINEQSSGAGNGLLKGLKAKELSLDDSVKNHNLAQASTPQSPSANHPTAHHAADSVKHPAHKASTEPVKHHAVSKHISPKSSSMSNKTTSLTKPTEADAQVPGAEGADGGAQATQSNSEEIANNATATDATKASDAPETTSYTVKEGDCLWNIAKDHLGDSSKWQEIYKLNSDLLGENPDLIHTGATIQLPGSDHLAVADAGEAAKYVVKSGDNLWDIAKHNLGGGTKWGDIYKLNHDVIGENPSLIHPGQEFNLGAPHEGVDTGKLADANVPGTDAPGADAAAGTPAVDHVAQAPAVPAGPAPSAFGQPAEATAALPEFGSPQSALAQHAPVEIQPSQPDPHMFAGGAATAAPAQPMAQPQSVAPSTVSTPTTDAGPGAAGAATLPEVGNVPGPVSPDKSSVVSSSMMSSLQDFITHKK